MGTIVINDSRCRRKKVTARTAIQKYDFVQKNVCYWQTELFTNENFIEELYMQKGAVCKRHEPLYAERQIIWKILKCRF